MGSQYRYHMFQFALQEVIDSLHTQARLTRGAVFAFGCMPDN